MNTLIQKELQNKIIKPIFSDKRGDIYDLVEENVSHVGLITFSKEAVRGNHYHKKSVQYSYILDGEIELTTSLPDGSEQKTTILTTGCLTIIPPGIVHTYKAITPARMLDITTLNRLNEGYEEDTVKLNNG